MRCVGFIIVWAAFGPGALLGQALFSTEVRLVEVHATVLEGGKRYVSGLGADAFEVLDEGEAQPLTVFEPDSSDLACAIVLDTTGSMKRSLPVVKNAVAAFIDDFRGSDLVSVYAFSSNLRQLQDFTGDKQLAKRAVFSTTAYGETALFNSASQVISDLEQVHGKRALLLFTDGDDNASAINAGAVIVQARRAGVPIYAVASGAALDNPTLIKQLAEMSETTGGRSYEMKKAKDAGEVFARIMEDLQHTYLLGYAAPPGTPGAWREIDVRVHDVKSPVVRSKRRYLLR